DRQAKLNSIPAALGIPAALRIAFVSHLLTILMLVLLWKTAALGPLFLTGIVLIGLLLLYEHWLVRPDDLTRVNIAFFNVNAIISFGILLLGCLDIWIF
ncbi:MAG TPA: 4-hydroxybenzoate octaprenyltransferase, partial [Planctomycetaceae bacterium]|nr:4-hydroxybenzoate octaprenyltransferase [Planctomycetaceae bacterium]